MAELTPQLISLFNYMTEEGKVTEFMSEALVSLIPKQGKDLKLCGSYRPISLLNLDAKLYTKILASQLEEHLLELIQPDQSGFIKGRQTHDHIRRVVHLIEKVTKKKILVVLLVLDAEKAFDRVDWGFLLHTLTKCGFCNKFITMVKANYVSPVARVLVNG